MGSGDRRGWREFEAILISYEAQRKKERKTGGANPILGLPRYYIDNDIEEIIKILGGWQINHYRLVI